MRGRRAYFRGEIIALVAALLAGCKSSAPQVEIVLRPSADANGARSVYVLARAVKEQAFGAEPYEAVAAQVTAPDASVEKSLVVLPGQMKTLALTAPAEGSLAIYALLERPEGDGWRLLLSSQPPKKLEIRIERSRICLVAKAGDRCAPPNP